jgi:transcriptional regulator with GAF, ATPase, and Fis domain
MRQRSSQVGGAVRSPREQDNTTSQAARPIQHATNLNGKKNLPEEKPCTNDEEAGSAGSHWKVMVWESSADRRTLIDRVVFDSGARAYHIEEMGDLERASCSSCCAAVVSLRTYPLDDTGVSRLIGRLRQAGLTVIAHEQGARSWSLGRRCQVLLAGASCVLDSEEPGFSRELRRIMTESSARKTRESAEKQRTLALMKSFGIVGESDAIVMAFRQALRASGFSDVAVLITGESGTGKELMARAIHQLDPKRCAGPFLAINCAAVSSGLAESELFGHSRGAFTGADRDRKGLIRAADGGVLFLDEIGELGSDIQAKLLRVLQDHRITSVGTDQEVGVDVRVIAATNRNLDLMMERGQFRVDLFHRLNMLSVHLPPLRDRVADLKPLVDNLLAKHRSGATSEISSVDRDFIEALAQLELPGNVRQLENIVRRAVLNKQFDAAPLGLSDFPAEIWQQLCTKRQVNSGHAGVACQTNPAGAPRVPFASGELIATLLTRLDSQAWTLSRVVHHCERLLVEAALQRAQGNHSQAARVLGITPRTLYNKLRKPDRDSDS